jgi:hypothetical protein
LWICSVLAAGLASGLAGCGARASGDDPTEAADDGAGEESAEAAQTSGPHVVERPTPELLTSETYYVTFFAYQRGLNVADKASSHTLAQYTRIVPDGAGDVRVAEELTVSWMPDSGVVRALGPAERGRNTELDFELRRGGQFSNSRGAAWGPFRVPRIIWDRAVRQTSLLATGRVAYKASGRDPLSRETNYLAVDRQREPLVPMPSFLNCLAAVGDVAPTGGTVVGSSSGIGGTQEIVDHYDPFFIDRPTPGAVAHDRHVWLSRRQNLARINAYYPRGVELVEKRGRNVSPNALSPSVSPNAVFSACACAGQPLRGGLVACTFLGQRPTDRRAMAVQTVVTAAYTSALECGARCAADWPEYSELCAGNIGVAVR